MPAPYYRTARGLRFRCTGCGDCCAAPGRVFFPGGELDRAARHLGLTVSAFRRRYGVGADRGVPVLDPGDAACPFLAGDRTCAIYPVRPTQCRTFPFWPEVARRRRSWERAARGCEGIGRGPRVSPARIEQAFLACADAGLPEHDPW